MLVAIGWLLSACSTFSDMNPINWWHRQEGGKIAEQRPPPPGADQPYPNVSTVPAKPAPPDADALKKLTDSLIADRTNAQHAAQAAPLADPSSPNASPALFGVGTATPPPPASAGSTAPGSPAAPTASASMPAVNAPPAPPSAPPPSAAPLSAAPRNAVQSTPLETPSSRIPASASVPNSGATSATPGTQPALPAAPPTRPAAAGAPPPAEPAPPEPMPAPSAGPSATIVFVEGEAGLSAPATDEVKAFAAKRGKGTISVTGYGDTPASDPDAQSAALTLGLTRAQSIVEALKAAGVPGNAIRVSAEASGRGASLHVLQ